MKGYPGMKPSDLKPIMKDVFTCPICGTPKTHHRLYGYRCSINPEHDEQARDMSETQLAEARAKWQDLK